MDRHWRRYQFPFAARNCDATEIHLGPTMADPTIGNGPWSIVYRVCAGRHDVEKNIFMEYQANPHRATDVFYPFRYFLCHR